MNAYSLPNTSPKIGMRFPLEIKKMILVLLGAGILFGSAPKGGEPLWGQMPDSGGPKTPSPPQGAAPLLPQNAPIEVTPQDGVLLLMNGEVLQGKITPVGDYYYVVVPNGQLRIRTADVEIYCRSLQEGYQVKRENIRLPSAQEHLNLGQWCVRHGLLDQAERELAEAIALQPDHPLISLLRRRIEIARQAPPPTPSSVPAPSTKEASQQLDAWLRTLPPGVVENFTQSVQPILLNNCTTAGCHGPAEKNRFALLKPPAGQPSTRRLTQRNLANTFQWINAKEPLQSPLLTAPLGPHGTAKTPVFGNPQSEAYQRLVRWVLMASGGSAPAAALVKESSAGPQTAFPAPPSLSPSDPHAQNEAPGEVIPAVAGEEFPQMVQQAGAWQPVPTPGLPRGPLQELLPLEQNASEAGPSFIPPRNRFSPPYRSEPKRGDPTQGFRPVDPFDPEIFNRRYHQTGETP